MYSSIWIWSIFNRLWLEYFPIPTIRFTNKFTLYCKRLIPFTVSKFYPSPISVFIIAVSVDFLKLNNITADIMTLLYIYIYRYILVRERNEKKKKYSYVPILYTRCVPIWFILFEMLVFNAPGQFRASS